MGQLKPKSGSSRVRYPTGTYTDQWLRNGIRKDWTLKRNLQSKRFDPYPWWAGKRQYPETLMDRLALPLACKHKTFAELSPKYQSRFVLLLLIMSRAQVFLIHQLWCELDEIAERAIHGWLHDFTGAVLIFTPILPETLQKFPIASLDAHGEFKIISSPEEGDTR